MKKPCVLWVIFACEQHAVQKMSLAGKGQAWYQHVLAHFGKAQERYLWRKSCDDGEGEHTSKNTPKKEPERLTILFITFAPQT